MVLNRFQIRVNTMPFPYFFKETDADELQRQLGNKFSEELASPTYRTVARSDSIRIWVSFGLYP